LRGAREMHDQVLQKINSHRLKIYVVWTPVLPGDSRKAAAQAVREVADGRAMHFWDEERILGKQFGKLLPLPGGKKFAWDIYLVYDTKTKWNAAPPSPASWMHQLGDDERVLDGEKLRSNVAAQLEH
jgi:hypothetical protein